MVYSDADMTMLFTRFTYDERGQRLLKESHDAVGNVAQRTWHLRDASGGEQYVLVQDDTQSTTSEQIPIEGTEISGWQWADLGPSAVGVAATYGLGGVALANFWNPVGWIVGAYFVSRTSYGIYSELSQP
jgi:hypothetical protein